MSRAARTAEVQVRASPEQCLDVVLDVETYPDWVHGYRCVDVEERDRDGRPELVEFAVGGLGIKGSYRLSYTYADDPPTVAFRQRDGTLTKEIAGRYTFEAEATGTRIRYEASVDLAVRVPGPLKRAAERLVMSAALDGLAREVERRRREAP